MKAEYKGHLGDDITIVNAARVSFEKESQLEELTDQYVPWSDKPETVYFLGKRDVNLISFLAREKHFTPFTHGVVQMRVTAPLFVARQLWKSHIGSEMSDGLTGLGWNEVSRRYVSSPPSFFRPTAWRSQADNVKQGSGGEIEEKKVQEFCDFVLQRNEAQALANYQSLLSSGVCAEQARMVLPQSMLTSWWWTGSLAFFARVCSLRMEGHAQHESQVLAKEIAEIVQPLFPVSWEALTK